MQWAKVTQLVLFGFGVMVTSATVAAAEAFPNKPIRIVTSEPGSSLDLTARLVAEGLTQNLGQQAIVDNRHVLTVETVVKALPDGYTLLAYGSSTWVAPMLSKDVKYDAVNDLAPVSLAAISPNVLVIHPKVAANSVRDLIALAKARPGKLNYGSSVSGGTPHLAGEMFKATAGIDIVRVPYKGVAIAVTDLIAGEIDLMFPTIPSGMPHVKTGRLRALGVTSARQSVLAPELPTLASQGLDGYELVAMFGIFAPARTPSAVIARLNEVITKHVSRPEIKAKLHTGGLELVGGSPAQFAAAIHADIKRTGNIINDAGITEQ